MQEKKSPVYAMIMIGGSAELRRDERQGQKTISITWRVRGDYYSDMHEWILFRNRQDRAKYAASPPEQYVDIYTLTSV